MEAPGSTAGLALAACLARRPGTPPGPRLAQARGPRMPEGWAVRSIAPEAGLGGRLLSPAPPSGKADKTWGPS